MFTTCAFIFSYGVYQSLYEEMAAASNTPFTGSSTALLNLVGILAIALMSMGGPFALRAMITDLGFRNALRISGCISLTLVSVAGYALRWELKFAEQVGRQTQGLRRRSGWIKAPMVNYRVARSKRFVAQTLSCFLQSAAYSTPLFFYAAYASTLGYNSTIAANFITLNNVSNFVSRIAVGYCADRYGRINALVATALPSAIAVFAFWLPSMFHDSHQHHPADITKSSADALFIVYTILYGTFASAYI
ncbi:major facilitator superfamily domain-containing protein [Aspergillus undulatus]|uniref:major facilitator superfamily domain-containing protein n=1 Tax=Aspergillus undulatus TaxID=1810928 RepID=UPI003CCC8F52